MHPKRLIVHMDRRSDSISTRIYDPNTVTIQSAGRNNAPREPPPWPSYMESCPTRPALHLCLCLLLRIHLKSLTESLSPRTAKYLPLRQYTAHCCFSYPLLALSLELAISFDSLVLTWFYFMVLTWFEYLVLTWLDSLVLTWFNFLTPTLFYLPFMT